ncbi:MAG: hypothetical protein WKG00_08360 [Polyangiaceae bacterium]
MSWVALLALTATATAAACGGSGDGEDSTVPSGSGGAASGGSDGSGADDDGITIGSGGSPTQSLILDPVDAKLDVAGSPATLAFTAKVGGQTPNNVIWSNDPDLPGFVDQDGMFHSEGFAGGVTTVRARAGNLEAATTLTVNAELVENPGALSQEVRDALVAGGGGGGDAELRWLYPYDRTIFPRGMQGPEMQLGGAAADAVYVKITLPHLSYEGFFGASSPTRVSLPADVWEGITLSAAAADDVQVEVTKMSGGVVTGPLSASWRIAQGSLKGVIYYNTYSSGGAVKRIKPGEEAQTFISGCPVCHSVASKGGVLAAGVNWGSGNPLDAITYDLLADGSVTPRFSDSDGRKFPFAGLTPDGDLALGSAVPSSGQMPRGLQGAFESKLWNTTTGDEVAAPTFTDVVKFALTPNFSHDGSLVAFTHQETDSRNLKMMGVDLTQDPPLFAGLDLLTTAVGNVAAWPSFLPDSKAVVYHDGERFDTQSGCNGASYANLRLVDVTTKEVSTLERMNGLEGGVSYLPFGEAEEANTNYEPTVLPVPVGGYYWVIFTSRRAYGNHLGPGGTEGGTSKWGTCSPETPSLRKKLWVAAIDTNWQGLPDPSHPAFYLPGQEMGTGNMRAFAALEPCKALETQCELSFECCDGKQCLPTGEVDEGGKPIKECQDSPSSGCSAEGGTCQASSDCCDPEQVCINGFCALQSPPS